MTTTSQDGNLEGLSPPPGLKLAEEIMTAEEETALIAAIDAVGLERFARDPTNPRSTKTFGWLYHADDTISLGEPLPERFYAIRDYAATFARVEPEAIEEIMFIRYDPGAIIQPHLDKPAWTHVIGVSLGAPVRMDFRRKTDQGFDYAAANLRPRSIYLMAGEARYAYQHSLPPVPATRWSITFRTLSDEGRRLRARAQANAMGSAPD